MVDVASVPGRRSFGSQLLTFRGRSNRANYWLTLLAIVAVYMAIMITTLVTFSSSDDPLDLHPIVIAIALLNWLAADVLWVFAAIRRLHDRDKSGHWLWLFAVAPGMLVIAAPVIEWAPGPSAIVGLVLRLLALAVFVWGMIELGFLRGTSSSNRFGPAGGS